MTPSENDLRAALRHGEADATAGPDVDRIIGAGRDRATQRRVRLLSGAAVVAVVTAAGVGGALLAGRGDKHERIAVGQKDNVPAQHAGTDGTALTGSARPAGPAGPVGPANCPSALPNPTASGNGIGAPANTSGRLFGKPVVALVVCSYAEGESASSPATTVLQGPQAVVLRTSLENAAKFRPAINCPTLIRADERSLAIYGVRSDGDRLTPVITKINAVPCRVIVTNGATTRYDWSPSAAVQALLKAVTSGPSLAPGVPGATSGAGGASGSGVARLPSGPAAPSGSGAATKHGSPIHT